MRILVLVCLFLMMSHSAFALSRKGAFQSTKVGVSQQNYTGSSKVSFAEGSPAYGIEVSTDTGGSHLRYFFKTRFNHSNGSQNFYKSGTTYFSKYDYSSIEPEVGVALYPVEREERGLNIYVWGVGNISYNYLSISSVPTTVNVEPKGQEFGSGYGAGIGFEFILYVPRGGAKILAYSEVGFRDSTAALAGANNFQVGGMTVSFGIGF